MGPLRALNARAPAPVPSSAAPPKPAPAPVVVAPRTNTTRMDDFSVVRKLGRGSFGEVFACVRRDDPSRRLVVVKKITMGAKRSDQEDAMNECRVLAKLDSPYVTKYYDSFVENGGKELCIVMEYAPKGTVHQLVRASPPGRLDESTIWKLTLQSALGLHHIHRLKILHRDIKSENIFLDARGDAKIGDLGVAKVMSHEGSLARTLVGTPYYLSPELCENKPYDHKSDVWSLGCVIYEMLTGTHPFHGDNQGALFMKILRGKYPPVNERAYGEDIRALLDRCLANDVRTRLDARGILRGKAARERAAALGLDLPEEVAPPAKIGGSGGGRGGGGDGARRPPSGGRPPTAGAARMIRAPPPPPSRPAAAGSNAVAADAAAAARARCSPAPLRDAEQPERRPSRSSAVAAGVAAAAAAAAGPRPLTAMKHDEKRAAAAAKLRERVAAASRAAEEARARLAAARAADVERQPSRGERPTTAIPGDPKRRVAANNRKPLASDPGSPASRPASAPRPLFFGRAPAPASAAAEQEPPTASPPARRIKYVVRPQSAAGPGPGPEAPRSRPRTAGASPQTRPMSASPQTRPMSAALRAIASHRAAEAKKSERDAEEKKRMIRARDAAAVAALPSLLDDAGGPELGAEAWNRKRPESAAMVVVARSPPPPDSPGMRELALAAGASGPGGPGRGWVGAPPSALRARPRAFAGGAARARPSTAGGVVARGRVAAHAHDAGAGRPASAFGVVGARKEIIATSTPPRGRRADDVAAAAAAPGAGARAGARAERRRKLAARDAAAVAELAAAEGEYLTPRLARALGVRAARAPAPEEANAANADADADAERRSSPSPSPSRASDAVAAAAAAVASYVGARYTSPGPDDDDGTRVEGKENEAPGETTTTTTTSSSSLLFGGASTVAPETIDGGGGVDGGALAAAIAEAAAAAKAATDVANSVPSDADADAKVLKESRSPRERGRMGSSLTPADADADAPEPSTEPSMVDPRPRVAAAGFERRSVRSSLERFASRRTARMEEEEGGGAEEEADDADDADAVADADAGAGIAASKPKSGGATALTITGTLPFAFGERGGTTETTETTATTTTTTTTKTAGREGDDGVAWRVVDGGMDSDGGDDDDDDGDDDDTFDPYAVHVPNPLFEDEANPVVLPGGGGEDAEDDVGEGGGAVPAADEESDSDGDGDGDGDGEVLEEDRRSRRDTLGEKVLKDRRSPRGRGHMGTSVQNDGGAGTGARDEAAAARVDASRSRRVSSSSSSGVYDDFSDTVSSSDTDADAADDAPAESAGASSSSSSDSDSESESESESDDSDSETRYMNRHGTSRRARVEELVRAMTRTEEAATALVGADAFGELYDFLAKRAEGPRDDENASTHATVFDAPKKDTRGFEPPSLEALSDAVFAIVPREKAEAVALAYRYMYLVGQLEDVAE